MATLFYAVVIAAALFFFTPVPVIEMVREYIRAFMGKVRNWWAGQRDE